MDMFLEIKIRQNGKERWVNAGDFLNYMMKHHLNEEASQGGVIPYPDEANKEQIFNTWWNAYDKKRSRKKVINYWIKNIKDSEIPDIINHTKKYVLNTEKQFRKDPYSYLFNECWNDEIILTPEAAQKEKEQRLEEIRNNQYQKQLNERKRINEEAADDKWKEGFFKNLKKDLIKKNYGGQKKMSITNESETS